MILPLTVGSPTFENFIISEFHHLVWQENIFRVSEQTFGCFQQILMGVDAAQFCTFEKAVENGGDFGSRSDFDPYCGQPRLNDS